jgi:type II secretory pathway pseudopilin PulG
VKRSGSKSGLFIVELIIALLLFAFCAAICLQLFVFADQRTKDSTALSKSVFLATSVAENFKASGGDLQEVTQMMGFPAGAFTKADQTGETIYVYYDADFGPVSEEARVYTLTVNHGIDDNGSPTSNANIEISYFGPRGEWTVFSMTAGGV